MDNVLTEKLARLPKWAKEHIAELTRQRDAAVDAMRKAAATKKPSPIYVEDYVCVGSGGPDRVRTYIDNYSVTVEYAGVVAEVSTHSLEGIEVRFGPADHLFGEIMVVPKHLGGITLVNPIHMASLDGDFSNKVASYLEKQLSKGEKR